MSALWTTVWPLTIAMLNTAGIIFGVWLAIEVIAFVITFIKGVISGMKG